MWLEWHEQGGSDERSDHQVMAIWIIKDFTLSQRGSFQKVQISLSNYKSEKKKERSRNENTPHVLFCLEKLSNLPFALSPCLWWYCSHWILHTKFFPSEKEKAGAIWWPHLWTVSILEYLQKWKLSDLRVMKLSVVLMTLGKCIFWVHIKQEWIWKLC